MRKTGGGRGTNQYRVKGASKRPSPASQPSGEQEDTLRATAQREARIGPDPTDDDAWDLHAVQYGETPIDEDARDQLTASFRHIKTKAELNRAEASNIAVAVAWLRENPFDTPRDLLNQPALRVLHRRMFVEVWTWAGQTRTSETNMGVDPALIVQQWENRYMDTGARRSELS